MTYSSVIRNFANIGIAQAEKLREQLSLSMSAEMLKYCGKYYKNQLKRDPFVDELKMLDMLVSTRELEGASLAITEFLTNDAFVARTYADLLKKRKQLWPEFSHPCTLREAVNIASEYILRARSENVQSSFSPSIENIKDSISYPDSACVAARNSAYRMRLLPIAQTAISDGDKLILMSPSGYDTQDTFRVRVASIFRNKEFMKHVKGVSKIGRGGILHELLRMTDGATIHLSALSPIDTTVPATTLCEGFCGYYMLRVASHQWNSVAALLARDGVHALPFATIEKEPKFVFVRDMQSNFVLDAHFLRSLNCYKTTCAKLADESGFGSNSISFGGIGGGICAYLTPKTATQIGAVAKIGSTACVSAYAKPQNAHYKTALWTLLAPVASLCAHGIPYSNQVLSLALEIPTDLTDSIAVGKCMSTILGLYRAQIELGLASAGGIFVRPDENIDTTSVSVWTTAQDIQETTGTFAKTGSFVYAISPVLDSDGLPDFSSLRQMLNQVAKFASEGKILSSRVLANEAITDGIRKMSYTHTCVLSDNAVAAQGKLPLCILIESEEVLPFCRIGKVLPFRRFPQVTPEIPETTDLIVNYHPDIVIVSSMMDNDAMALAAFLEEHWGARVSLFMNPKKDAVDLSRAILTTQTLILCPNVKLPKTKYMDFALDTLHRAGGIFLSLSKNSTPEGFIPLKNGIDVQVLLKICPGFFKILKKL